MTVIVYHQDHLYSDTQVLDKVPISNQLLSCFHSEKIFSNGITLPAIGVSGRTLTKDDISLYSGLIGYFCIAEYKSNNDNLKKVYQITKEQSQAIDEYLSKMAQVFDQSKLIEYTDFHYIGGFKDYVITNNRKVKGIGRFIDPKQTYCIGSDALPVQMLIDYGYTPEAAIKKVAERSPTISDNVIKKRLPSIEKYLDRLLNKIMQENKLPKLKRMVS